jgi:hypothetical protein
MANPFIAGDSRISKGNVERMFSRCMLKEHSRKRSIFQEKLKPPNKFFPWKAVARQRHSFLRTYLIFENLRIQMLPRLDSY